MSDSKVYIYVVDTSDYCNCCNNGKRTGPKRHEARLQMLYGDRLMVGYGRTGWGAKRDLIHKLSKAPSERW